MRLHRLLLPLVVVLGLLGLTPVATYAVDGAPGGVSVSWDEPAGSYADGGVRFHLETEETLLPSSYLQVAGGARTYYSGSSSMTVAPAETGPMTVRWHVETLQGSVADGQHDFLVDLTRPTVTWNRPAPGAYVLRDSDLRADVTCHDDLTIESCGLQPARAGDRLDTSTLGTHEVKAVAVNAGGVSGTAWVSYDVVDTLPSTAPDDPAEPTVATTTVLGPDGSWWETTEDPVLSVGVTAADGSTVTGTVDVLEGDVVLATGRLRTADVGRVAVRLPALEAGTHVLHARFRGAGAWLPSTSTTTEATSYGRFRVETLLDHGSPGLEPGKPIHFRMLVTDAAGHQPAGEIQISYHGKSSSEVTRMYTRSVGARREATPIDVEPGDFDPSTMAYIHTEFLPDGEQWPWGSGFQPVWCTFAPTELHYTATPGAPFTLWDDEVIAQQEDQPPATWQKRLWYNDLDPVILDEGSLEPATDGDRTGLRFTPPADFDGRLRLWYSMYYDDPDTRTQCSKPATMTIDVGTPWIDGVELQQQKFPSTTWTTIGQGGTTAGNPVQASVSLTNPDTTATGVEVELVDVATMRPIGLPTEVLLEARASRTVAIPVDTYRMAYAEDGSPQVDPRRIRVRVTPEGGGTSHLDTTMTVHPRPVVMVHGYKSNALDSWGREGDGASFGEILRAAVHPDLTTWAVGDGRVPGRMNTGSTAGLSDWTLTTNLISGNAAQEATYVEGVRARTGAWHVDLVAHSMGGLISRDYIQELMPASVDDKPVVTHLVQLGTPNQGSPCADMLMLAGRVSEDGAVPLMPATMQLSTSWIGQVFNRTVTDLRGVPVSNLVGTTLPVPCGAANVGDGVVPDWSARWVLPTADRPEKVIEHTHMTGNQDVAASYVGPRLRDEAGAVPGTPTALRAAAREVAAEPATSTPAFAAQQVVVPGDGTREVALDVPAGQQVGLFTTGRRLGLRLLDPEGHQVDGFTAYDDRGEGPFLGLRAVDPTPGRWTLQVTNPNADAVTIPLVGWVEGSPLVVAVEEAAVSGSGAHVTARVSDGGQPVVDAQVSARLAETGTAATLADDGQHGDGAAGDGLYGATLPTAGDAVPVVVDAAAHGQRRLVSAVAVRTGGTDPGPTPDPTPDPTPAPVITRQPTATTVAAGGRGTMRVAATGSSLTYGWQRRSPGGSWRDLAGALGPALALQPTTLAESGTAYRAVVTGPGGSTTSAPATLTVRAATIDLRVSAPATVRHRKRPVVTIGWTSDGAAPSGAVTLLVDRRRMTVALTDGVSQVRLPRLRPGRHTVTAIWAGSPTTAPARSARVRIAVRR